MSISCQCPSCGRQYSLGDALAGKKARCRQCATVFTVVAAQAAAPSPPNFAPQVQPAPPRQPPRTSFQTFNPGIAAPPPPPKSASAKLWIVVSVSAALLAMLVIAAIIFWPRFFSSGVDKFRIARAAFDGKDGSIMYMNIDRALAAGAIDTGNPANAPHVPGQAIAIQDVREMMLAGELAVVRFKSTSSAPAPDGAVNFVEGFETGHYANGAATGYFARLGSNLYAMTHHKTTLEDFLKRYAAKSGSMSASQETLFSEVSSEDFIITIPGAGPGPSIVFGGSFSGSDIYMTAVIDASNETDAKKIKERYEQQRASGKGITNDIGKFIDITIDGTIVRVKAVTAAKDINRITPLR